MTKQYRGVTRRTTRAGTVRYDAALSIKGRTTHIGSYDTPLIAARAYDKAAKEHHGDMAVLNFDGRLITIKEEQIYRLCHPDFYDLPYWAVAELMHMSLHGIYMTMRRIKRKCPSLSWGRLAYETNQISYKPWMDEYIVMKF